MRVLKIRKVEIRKRQVELLWFAIRWVTWIAQVLPYPLQVQQQVRSQEQQYPVQQALLATVDRPAIPARDAGRVRTSASDPPIASTTLAADKNIAWRQCWFE